MLTRSRLLLCGGGPLPTSPLRQHLANEGKVLVIPWASEFPDSAFQRFSRKLELSEEKVLVSKTPPSDALSKKRLLHMLQEAESIFFTGGDQNKIMRAFEDQELKRSFLAAFERGKLMGGTSAGTAIMSEIMIKGDGKKGRPVLGEGLGFLTSAVLDQHFIKRSRHRRLALAMSASTVDLGLGIDEGAVALLEGSDKVSVLSGKVVLIDLSAGYERRKVFRANDTFTLSTADSMPYSALG